MENRFSPLVFAVMLFCLGGYTYNPAVSIQQDRYEFPVFGRYRVHGEAPKGYKTFHELEVKLKSADEPPSTVKIAEEGELLIDGAVFIRPGEFRSGVSTERQGEFNALGEASFVDVVRLKFTSAKLQLEGNRLARLSFATELVDDISYAFDGRFLENAILEKGGYVELVGNLRKFKNGRQQAESKLKFLRWAYE